jgi:hypothetical protein
MSTYNKCSPAQIHIFNYATLGGRSELHRVVNGEFDPGFHRIRARSEHPAQEKIEGWQGRMVVVRYSPDKRGLSARLKSDQPGGRLGN